MSLKNLYEFETEKKKLIRNIESLLVAEGNLNESALNDMQHRVERLVKAKQNARRAYQNRFTKEPGTKGVTYANLFLSHTYGKPLPKFYGKNKQTKKLYTMYSLNREWANIERAYRAHKTMQKYKQYNAATKARNEYQKKINSLPSLSSLKNQFTMINNSLKQKLSNAPSVPQTPSQPKVPNGSEANTTQAPSPVQVPSVNISNNLKRRVAALKSPRVPSGSPPKDPNGSKANASQTPSVNISNNLKRRLVAFKKPLVPPSKAPSGSIGSKASGPQTPSPINKTPKAPSGSNASPINKTPKGPNGSQAPTENKLEIPVIPEAAAIPNTKETYINTLRKVLNTKPSPKINKAFLNGILSMNKSPEVLKLLSEHLSLFTENAKKEFNIRNNRPERIKDITKIQASARGFLERKRQRKQIENYKLFLNNPNAPISLDMVKRLLGKNRTDDTSKKLNNAFMKTTRFSPNARAYYLKQFPEWAATKIQASTRGFLERKRQKKQEAAATKIQTSTRDFLERKRQRQAATKLQAKFRTRQAMKTYKNMKAANAYSYTKVKKDLESQAYKNDDFAINVYNKIAAGLNPNEKMHPLTQELYKEKVGNKSLWMPVKALINDYKNKNTNPGDFKERLVRILHKFKNKTNQNNVINTITRELPSLNKESYIPNPMNLYLLRMSEKDVPSASNVKKIFLKLTNDEQKNIYGRYVKKNQLAGIFPNITNEQKGSIRQVFSQEQKAIAFRKQKLLKKAFNSSKLSENQKKQRLLKKLKGFIEIQKNPKLATSQNLIDLRTIKKILKNQTQISNEKIKEALRNIKFNTNARAYINTLVPKTPVASRRRPLPAPPKKEGGWVSSRK